LDRQGKAKAAQIVSAQADGLFFSDETLDVALVQLAETPPGVSPLTLSRQRLERDSRVSIIQHPGGHYKKISMQNNFVAYADSQVVQYTTSTEPGSSGSPVFNDEFEVIAIHHSGGMLAEPNSGRRYLRNAGSTMMAVLRAVEQHAPELYKLLQVG
jgi:V8-like Glu-specific endopeptidase